MGWVVHGTNSSLGELSMGWNVHGVKCRWGELSIESNVSGKNVCGAKCPWGEMSMGQNVTVWVSWGDLCMGLVATGRVVLAPSARLQQYHQPGPYCRCNRWYGHGRSRDDLWMSYIIIFQGIFTLFYARTKEQTSGCCATCWWYKTFIKITSVHGQSHSCKIHFYKLAHYS